MGYFRNKLERSHNDFNDNKIDLLEVVVIKLQDKLKVRRLMNRKPLLFHLMLKQGITWFTLVTETQETV